MKRILQLAFLILISSIWQISYGQSYAYEMKLTEFIQTSETEYSFEVYLRKTPDSDLIGIESFQFQINFNLAILNGGEFKNAFLTVDASETDFVGNVGVITDNLFVTDGTNVLFASSSTGNAGSVTTVLDDNWKKAATFYMQLSKSGNPHNFGSANPLLKFRTDPTMLHTLVIRCDVTGSPGNYIKDGLEWEELQDRTLIPDYDTPLATRQLAGYWFSGEGNWVEAARWNNVTTENRNIVPPLASNNATIAGNCTLTELRIINQLVVAEGGYLVLNEVAELTTTDLYNDNQSAAKNRSETIAAWDFEGEAIGVGASSYNPDLGIDENALLGAESGVAGLYINTGGSSPSTRAYYAYRFWESGGMGPEIYRSWKMTLNTTGYQNLKLYSKQWADNNAFGQGDGSANWSIETSTNGTDWTLLETITVGNDWTTGVLDDNLNNNLPSDLNNVATVFIRWRNTDNKPGYAGIDDIIITGDEIPPPPTGILIQSTASGTGSLIHNNNDVEATLERYIPAVASNSVYHLVSVPLTQASNPRSGLFKWSYLFNFDVPTQEWVAMGTSLYNPLFVNQGYMIYKYPGPEKWETDTTYSFAGPMNNGSFTCNVAFPNSLDNHNLVPNPYPSAIDWDATSGWTKSNVNNAIWIWNPVSGNYASWIANVSNNGGSRYIPVGQSFFVSASAAAPALIMDNDVRVHNNAAFLKNKEELPDLLRVKAFANNFSDEAVVRFADGATAGFDGQYDASKFYGSPEAPQLFTMSSDDKQLSINAMEVGTGKRIVGLGFTLEATGLCTLNFSGIESFNSDMQIHLNDRVTGQQINLRTTPEYSFAHSPENAALRFELVFDGVTAIADVKPVNQDFFYADGKLYLNFPQDSQGPFDITVYNINGQTEFMGVAHDAKAVVGLGGLTSGFHIVRVVTNNYSGEKKVVVK